MSGKPRPAARLLRLLAALVVLAVFADPIVHGPTEPGLSTFGRPPELAVLWAVAGVGAATLLARAASRAALARRLTLTLLGCCLFGQHAVPAQPGALLALAGLSLLVARPLLVPTPSGWAALGALAAAVPAVLTSPFPLGSVLFCSSVVPWCVLGLLLPSLLRGGRARRAGLVFVGTTSLFALASLASYLQLADGLALPLSSLAATRLRPLGLHPNLAVPQLVTALVVGCALAWHPTERRRRLVAFGLLPIVLALAAVQSRTGHLAAAGGLGLLVALRLPWRGARLVRPAVAIALVAALLLPVTGLSDGTITRASTRSMVSKAVSFRSAMWELGRDTAAAAPWQGFGPGRQHVQGRYARSGRYDGLPKNDHPHNVVLAVRSMLGWPGLLALAALLALGLRRAPGISLLADGATAALCTVWAANSLDMGGAAQTYYPALAFVLLALGDAAAPGRPTGGGRLLRPAATLLALVALPLGLASWTSNVLRVEAERVLESEPADTDRAGRLLDTALTVSPWDPRILLAHAERARLAHEEPMRIVFLERALALRPDSAGLVHELAQLRAAEDPDDPRVVELLDRALQLDRWGEGAWRRHFHRAQLAAHEGDEAAALEGLVTALVMSPGAAPQAGWDGERLNLTVDGQTVVRLPLDQVLAEVGRRREDLGQEDPPTALRLRLREVEILEAVGLRDRAAERARRVLGDDSHYVELLLGRGALAQARHAEERAREGAAGAAEQAASLYAESAERLGEAYQGHVQFGRLTDLLEARSHLDDEGDVPFEELVERALASEFDVVFEAGSVKQLLAARRRAAERRLDPAAASRFAQAEQYAAR